MSLDDGDTDVMAASVAEGYRIVDRGNPSYLLECHDGRWEIKAAIGASDPVHDDVVAMWPLTVEDDGL